MKLLIVQVFLFEINFGSFINFLRAFDFFFSFQLYSFVFLSLVVSPIQKSFISLFFPDEKVVSRSTLFRFNFFF